MKELSFERMEVVNGGSCAADLIGVGLGFIGAAASFVALGSNPVTFAAGVSLGTTLLGGAISGAMAMNDC